MIARGDAAYRLAFKLLTREDDFLLRIKGAARPDLIMLLAEKDDLPWVDGSHYFGIDPEAPSLFIPTHSRPSVSIGFVAKALLTPGQTGQYIISPEHDSVIPTGLACPLDRTLLMKWLKEDSQ
jgi:hypothetical protein